jgi:DNA replication protein DnaD
MLLTAFDKVWKDPALLKEAAKMGFAIDPISGETLQKAVEEAFSFPPETVKRAAELTTP